jgi:hypothetical protein
MSSQIVESQGSPSDVVRYALKQEGVTVDQLEKLLIIEERYKAGLAKQAFHRAISEFKKIPIKITKDKQNKQYNSMYTTIGNLVNTVNPELSKNGLSASWEIDQSAGIKVTCILTHSMGHSERTSAIAPADTSGSKNPIQQIKSTITYLKALTFESITGLASTDANFDDDGQGSTGEFITEAEYSKLLDHINNEGLKEQAVCDYLKVEDLRKLPKKELQKAMRVKNAKKG